MQHPLNSLELCVHINSITSIKIVLQVLVYVTKVSHVISLIRLRKKLKQF